MLDFIQFKFFIAQDVLTIFYILSSILLPIVCWYSLLWVLRRYLILLKLYKGIKNSVTIALITWIMQKIRFFQKRIDTKITWNSLTGIQKLKLVALFLFIVLLSEIFLRLIFEFLIAFMQMHEALVKEI